MGEGFRLRVFGLRMIFFLNGRIRVQSLRSRCWATRAVPSLWLVQALGVIRALHSQRPRDPVPSTLNSKAPNPKSETTRNQIIVFHHRCLKL